MRRLRSIQYLRALAALSVVLYHAGQWSGPGFAIGAAGVDLFFVISGFVMGLTIQDPAAAPKTFISHRLWRIGPPYWLVSLLVFGLALSWPRLLPRVYPVAGDLALSLLFIPHLDPAGMPFPLLPVGWSLTYEMVFYGIVAVCLTQSQKRRFRILAWGLVAVMACGVLIRPAYFLVANPMMLQFLAGALIARAYDQRRLPRQDAGWGLIVAGLALFFGLSWFDLYASLWRPLLWGAPAALIVAGAVSLEAQSAAFKSGWLAILGDASYSIYLCHWPVVVILAKTVGARPSWLFTPLASVAAVGVGLLFWRFVEQPMLRWGRRKMVSGSRLPTSSMEAAAKG